MNLKILLKNKIFSYSLVTYLSQFLAFLNVFFISIYLDVYDFGVYGIISLFLSYLAYSNFGINYSFVNYLSLKSKRFQLSEKIYSNSVLFTILIFFVIYFVLLLLIELISFDKQFLQIEPFFHYVLFVALLNNLNNIYIKLYRVYNNVNKLTFNQFFPPFLLFITLLYFSKNVNIYLILTVMLLSRTVCLLNFLIKTPLKFDFKFHYKILTILLKKGMKLLFFNFSFGFISIATLSIYSILYSVEEFATYKLAFTIGTTPILIGSAIENLIYPKVFNKISNLKNQLLTTFLKKISETYIASIIILNLFIIFLFPLINIFFFKYTGIEFYLFSFLIGNIFLIKSYHFRILMVANGYETKLAYFSLFSCLIVFLVSVIISHLKIQIYYQGFSYMIGSFFFLFLNQNYSKKFNIKFNLSLRLYLNSILVIIIGVIIYNKLIFPIYFVLPFLIFGNLKLFKSLTRFMLNVFTNNNLLKI
jgi:O-antigen/teichoic acid export membrane protein